MDDQPNPLVLNRDRTKADIASYLGPQLSAIRSMVDYGCNLIERAIGAGEGSLGSMIAVGVFLKQVVAMADAVDVLLAEGSVYACHLPARGAFEASLYLDYVLEKDTELRARRFYVADIRDQMAWARKGVPGTTEAAAHAALREKIGASGDRAEFESRATASHVELLAYLDRPEQGSVNAEFSAKRGKGQFDPPWYSLDGIRSLRALAEHLDRLADYEAFYTRGSGVMHSGTFGDHLKARGDGKVSLTPIRHVSDMSALLRTVFTVTLGSYSKVTATYLSHELEATRAMYVSKWRPAFMGVPDFKFDYQ